MTRSELRVTMAHSNWGFIYDATTPHLTLDGGAPIAAGWRTVTLPVTPGRHQLTCHFRWGIYANAGRSTVEIHVPDDRWYPDPTNRHQLRYFRGQRWTAHVSDAGVVSEDAI